MKNILVSMYTYHVKEMLFITTCKQSVLIKRLVCITLVLAGLVLIIVPHLITDKNLRRQRVRYPTDLKYILFLTHKKRQHKGNFIIGKSPEFLTGQNVFIAQNCSYINCYITYDKNTLSNNEDYDVVVFDIDNLKRIDVDRLNLTRAPEQIYIFRSSEAPERHPVCNRGVDRFFNWTWTYKLNSDIPQPFYSIYNKDKTIVGPKKGMKWIEKMKRNEEYSAKRLRKSKAVAWIVNKCKIKTKHQDFIDELKNELKGYNYTVDLFGSCGTHKCSSTAECYEMIEKTYFFQLVLEEHYAEDYVSDNIAAAMSYFTIPIVIGAGEYRNFLPPGAYVNAQAFDLKKLGALIDYLIKNTDMYSYFFDWKNYYYYKQSSKSQVCNLCEKLNKNNRTSKSYKHFRYWWDPEYKDTCQRMHLYKMFNNEK